MIKRVELGRAALRYDLGRRVCEKLDASQLWLSLGVGSPQPVIPVAPELQAEIPAGALFSHAVEEYLVPAIGNARKDLAEKLGGHGIKVQVFVPIGLPHDKVKRWMLLHEVDSAMEAIPLELRQQFCQVIMQCLDEFCVAHGVQRRSVGLLRPKPTHPPKPPDLSQLSALVEDYFNATTKKKLTDAEISEKVGSVKAQMPELLERLRKATGEPGKKTALAEFLGRVTGASVPLASVSRWLSGDREPGGEIALLMLRWLELQEWRGKQHAQKPQQAKL